MSNLRFVALPTEDVRALQAGGPDANGLKPERHISDGKGVPCRHCLAPVAAGEPYLILNYRPFPEAQPYAESGPIFLHAEPCTRHAESPQLPKMFRYYKQLLLRGYNRENRIIYGTGQVVIPEEAETALSQLLENPQVAYVHMRSATNNCYQGRVERG